MTFLLFTLIMIIMVLSFSLFVSLLFLFEIVYDHQRNQQIDLRLFKESKDRYMLSKANSICYRAYSDEHLTKVPKVLSPIVAEQLAYLTGHLSALSTKYEEMQRTRHLYSFKMIKDWFDLEDFECELEEMEDFLKGEVFYVSYIKNNLEYE